MSTDYFIFGGVDTRTYNAKVFRPNVETVGPQLYTTYEIPGRNGNILLPKGKYPNRRERYSILCTGENAVQNMDNLKNKLLELTGYQRMTDSFDTDIYYQAALTDQFDIQYTRERDAAKCQITFNRMPQKFFVAGDNTTWIIANVTQSGETSKTITLTNPSAHNSKPYIEISSSTILTINGFVIQTGEHTEAKIDCQTMEIKTTSYGHDEDITFSGEGLPVLSSGDNTITVEVVDSSHNALAKITPRWWKL